jgi:hypothetical protein
VTEAAQRTASRLSTAGTAAAAVGVALLAQSGVQSEILVSAEQPDYQPPIATPATVEALGDVFPQPLQRVPMTAVPQLRPNELLDRRGGTVLSPEPMWLLDSPAIAEERVDPHLVLLGKWAGTVLIVSGDVFTARIRDLNAVAPDEEGEFSVDEFSAEERDLVMPGANFYWYITRQNTRYGKRQLIEEFKLQRLGRIEAPKTSEWADRIASAAEQHQRKSPTSPSIQATRLTTSTQLGFLQRLEQWIGRRLNQTK